MTYYDGQLETRGNSPRLHSSLAKELPRSVWRDVGLSWLPVPRWLALLFLFSVSYVTQSLAQVCSCTATYTCPSGVNECYRLNGGGQVSTRPVPGTFASEAACTTYVINANPKGQSISCSCQGGSAGAS